jgi:uncharacterized protein (TIGR02596 family)
MMWICHDPFLIDYRPKHSNPMNSKPKFQSRAFSLIEMMIVLTVLGILFAISAPNLFTMIQATSLSSEGSFLRNQLTQAQQKALSQNADVEVRFFKMADESNAELEELFRGFQYFQFNPSGELVPVSKFYRIRPPVIISESFSTLLQPGDNRDDAGKEFGFLAPTKGKAEVPTGSEMIDAEYISFRFRPDGSTDLPGRAGSNDTWYLTLLQGAGAESNTLPDNYFTIQLDPFNGRISEFRP